jgi:hypothetical protein
MRQIYFISNLSAPVETGALPLVHGALKLVLVGGGNVVFEIFLPVAVAVYTNLRFEGIFARISKHFPVHRQGCARDRVGAGVRGETRLLKR